MVGNRVERETVVGKRQYCIAIGSALMVTVCGLAACESQDGKTTGPSPTSSASTTIESPSPTTESATPSPLPKHFRIDSEGRIEECRVDGAEVSCTTQLNPMPDNVEIAAGEFTGTLSGLTVTGTLTTQETFHMTDPSCRTVQRRSGPATYEFSLDGTVVMGEGLMQTDGVNTGDCPGKGPFSGKHWGGQGTGTWSPITGDA